MAHTNWTQRSKKVSSDHELRSSADARLIAPSCASATSSARASAAAAVTHPQTARAAGLFDDACASATARMRDWWGVAIGSRGRG
jgi:hypothetical protein